MRNAMIDIGKNAAKLSKNPLGIIALFIVLIYGFATLLLCSVGTTLSDNQKWWFVVFLVIFPVVVLGVFAYLVVNHHQKLYAPSEFRDEGNFFGRSSQKDLEKKYDEEAEVLESSSGCRSMDEKSSIAQRMTERREKIQEVKDLVFDYYEEKFNYDIDRHDFFDIDENKIIFDGMAEKKNRLVLFEIKYLPRMTILPKILYENVVFRAIRVKEFLTKCGNYPNYKYKLKLILVMDSANYDEKMEIRKKVYGMINTSAIDLFISVRTIEELRKC